jgi:hypothetical protein
MELTRKDNDSVVRYPLNQAVLLINAARPAAAQILLERFRLAQAREWIT